MISDAERLANIRTMLNHFDRVQDKYEFSNILDDAVLLREWILNLLDGEPYNWKLFTVELLTQHYWDGAISGDQLFEYKQEIGYEG